VSNERQISDDKLKIQLKISHQWWNTVKKTLLVFILLARGGSLFSQVSEERHLRNIRQLTFGGTNAEAYFSFDGTHLTCQITNPEWGYPCDQIFDIDIEKAAGNPGYRPTLISTGRGRTTCSFFLPDNRKILYASTHLGSDSCPTPVPKTPGKYLWAVYPDYDIFIADTSGKIVKQLTNSPGYDAEGTVSPDGKKIVFTSIRSGDLELWTMDTDGNNLKQVTHELGYDGGAFFSPDSKKLVFRASRPKTREEIKEYRDFLSRNIVAPTSMEIFTCNADGSDLKQITKLGKANWAPYFTHDGRKIIFSSNAAFEKVFDFQLFIVNADGTGLVQVTTQGTFNAFPMFSPDGKKLVWSSNRSSNGTHTIDLYIADWKK
jgi:TolB protein